MEYTAVFQEQVSLTSNDLKREIESIDKLLEQKLSSRLESRCSRHGFVLPDSIKILSRSMGSVERGRFTGDLIFHVQAEGGVLNPPDGTIVEGDIIRKNKMGLYVNYRDAIRIIVPRDVNIGNDEFESVEIGEFVKVEIKKSRFQVNDEYILSVGLFKGRGSKKAKGLLAQIAPKVQVDQDAPEDEEEEEEEEEERDDELEAEAD
jgi:DNA-directed RNA polymerase subunit E'/Rpb7